MSVLLQVLMVGIWALTFVTHTRRLVRLARVQHLHKWREDPRRTGLNRIWWWLGQDEFWHGLAPDTLKAIELTVMIFLIAWGMSQ